MSQVVEEITVTELKAMQDQGDDFVLIDVREPDELKICRIDGSQLIPLGELESRLGELDKSKSYIMQCRSGGRSATATALLLQNGFTQVKNLQGGILAWADQIDPTMKKY